MSTVYLMNLYGHDIVSPWEECKAKTLKTAKREAWTRFSGGFHHHEIQVAIEDRTGQRAVISRRKMVGKKWEDIPF